MSSKKQREVRYEFIVDEDLGKTYAAVLAADERFATHRFFDHFEEGTKDEVWIPEVARLGLIAITHDGKIRSRHKDKVIDSGARLIVSVGKDDFKGQTTHFVQSWAVIERFLRKHDAPYMARFRRPSPDAIARKRNPKGTIVLWTEE